ncbi:rhomboid family intramembrane serine protease [Azospirillum thermophilum]|uniref:Rhomboid family intramembrane serine protease n=1 Tax=Azospirillum thermophilum TaxID=2202148 RepID=A0A2S2CQP7_9PROT|nr:rhomboid family intramembrane serine protease [Azospirillum thermophilum]AWK86853.1 rhomboid family intramembrane serine protease [Azospirillum thermophilum]
MTLVPGGRGVLRRGRGMAEPAALPVVPAYANRTLILACVLSFVLQLPPERFAFVPAYFFGTMELAGPLPTLAVWRGLFGHVFIHADILHLACNMAFLLPFGNAVEATVGHWRYLLLFFAGAVAGALLEGAIATDPMAPLIGASGAICGVLGAFVILRPRPFALLYRPALWIVVGFGLLNLYMVVVPPAAGSPLAEIGWGAHLGGCAAGIALALLMRPAAARRAGG